jgi:hemerythrin-like domain-containing protein
MKATTLLERQHRNLQQLCEAVERGSPSMRESLLPQLANDLAAHIAVEEQIFYPAATAALHEERWARGSHARHEQAKESLDHALDTPVDQEAAFASSIAELRAIVELHVEEEEELLFPLLENAMPPAELRAIADRMMALYHAKVEAGYASLSGTAWTAEPKPTRHE